MPVKEESLGGLAENSRHFFLLVFSTPWTGPPSTMYDSQPQSELRNPLRIDISRVSALFSSSLFPARKEGIESMGGIRYACGPLILLSISPEG